MIKEAIVLCGGQGTRLRPLTNDRPKALVEVDGKPLLQWQIEWLERNGTDKIILACGYMADKIEKFAKSFDTKIKFVVVRETKPLGTGGAVKNAMKFISSRRFVVVNVDDVNDIPLAKAEKIGKNVVCLAHPRLPFGSVNTSGDAIVGFDEKPVLNDVWVNMGVYILGKDVVNELPDEGSIEYETFPKLAKNGCLNAYKHTGVWQTINALKDIDDFKRPW